MNELSELLTRVDALFPHKKIRKGPDSYDYTLGKFPRGWSFDVVNSWHKWSDKRLQHQFGIWNTPEGAILEFLDYVKENNINVKSLMEKP
jgi:hypothetical protein